MNLSKPAFLSVLAVLAGVWSLIVAMPVQAQGSRTVRCESNDGKFNHCNMPWRDAELVKQESKGACIRGQSWGVDREGLWVDRGCRGIFAEGRRSHAGYDRPGHDRPGYAGGWQPGPDWDRSIRLQCDSNSKRYQMCRVDVGRNGRAQLVRRTSDARCTEGYSWGWNRAGVWVDHGCRGQFLVERRR
ncbi:MAG: DUF3011 domain-containing protein [Rhodanobacter sp.]